MEENHLRKQFVILEHKTSSGVHWDLMLENDRTLWTWRLEIPPSKIDRPAAAERIFDHPLKFLTYEGPVQNGTGRVTIVDKGLLCLHQKDTNTIICELDGKILNGFFDLQLQNAPMWTFARHQD